MAKGESGTSMCAAVCLIIFWSAIGAGLLGGASQKSCGVTLESSKITSEQRVGTVYNSSVQEVPGLGSVVNYVFNNYLTLVTAKNLRSNMTVNDTCFLTVYNGPVYSIGQASLLSVNDTITTNFKRDIKECYLVPQKESCDTEQGLTIAGIVLLSIAGLNVAIILCCLSCAAGLLCCMKKKESRAGNLSSV